MEGATIKKAAQLLGINYSTAKHIMKQHKAANPHISNLNQLALTQRLLKDKQCANADSMLQKIQQNVASALVKVDGQPQDNRANIEGWREDQDGT